MTHSRFVEPSNANEWRTRALIGSVVLLAVIAVALASQLQESRETTNRVVASAVEPRSGLVMPTFRGMGTGGSRVVGSAEGDSAQLVFFFSDACTFCQRSTPALNHLFDKLRDDSVARVSFIAVSVDTAASAGNARPVADALKWPVVGVPERKLLQLYRAQLVPVVYLLDASGVVVQASRGMVERGAATDSILTRARSWRAERDRRTVSQGRPSK